MGCNWFGAGVCALRQEAELQADHYCSVDLTGFMEAHSTVGFIKLFPTGGDSKQPQIGWAFPRTLRRPLEWFICPTKPLLPTLGCVSWLYNNGVVTSFSIFWPSAFS